MVSHPSQCAIEVEELSGATMGIYGQHTDNLNVSEIQNQSSLKDMS